MRRDIDGAVQLVARYALEASSAIPAPVGVAAGTLLQQCFCLPLTCSCVRLVSGVYSPYLFVLMPARNIAAKKEKDEDLKQFSQWGSSTPGHPENFENPGVEVTTGPFG